MFAGSKGRFAWTVESATAKAVIPNVLAVAVGVFSGALITDVTTPAGLLWSLAIRSSSLYVLVGLTGLSVVYSRLLYVHDREVTRFLDKDYCEAYMRSKCLPELAEKAQERIRNGQGGEFDAAMNEVRRALGLP